MIAIISDFGDSEYLGVMKGVILSQNPKAKIIDLCNTCHSVREAAWVLFTTYRYYPKGTVFLCVVDPGVGSKRQALAVETKNYFFVGPDNGLMHPAIMQDGIKEVVKLDTGKVSATFHGRDVFAPAAARLLSKTQLTKLRKKAKITVELNLLPEGRTGEVVRIDTFGNIITNIPHINRASYKVEHKGRTLELEFSRTYSEAAPARLFVIEGSAGTLEISLKGKKATEFIKVEAGDRIRIF
ncbi:MAG: SAM-dependent chlorinase/fluorinase [Candidatus Woesearchaeota archaeon]